MSAKGFSWNVRIPGSISHEISHQNLSYIRRFSDHFGLLPEFVLKLKLKTKFRRSSVDLIKILDEDLSKI